MSKKSKRRDQRASPILTANKPLLVPRLIMPAVAPLKAIEDRRTYHPDKHRSLQTVTGGKHRLKVAQKPKVIRGPGGKPLKSKPAKFNPLKPFSSLSARIGFAAPNRLVHCLKRKIRKEVMFAKKLTRKGAGSRRSRNQWSNVQC